MPFVRWQKFNFFVRWGVLFFLGSACVSPSWSAGLCRDTVKLFAKLRSSEKSGQDVKGRWLVVLLMVVVSSVRLACNGLGLCEGGEIEVQMFNLAQMLIEVQCSNLVLLPHFCKTPVMP